VVVGRYAAPPGVATGGVDVEGPECRSTRGSAVRRGAGREGRASKRARALLVLWGAAAARRRRVESWRGGVWQGG
jgi:hypothetical protein